MILAWASPFNIRWHRLCVRAEQSVISGHKRHGNVDLVLVHRLWHWLNMMQTLAQCLLAPDMHTVPIKHESLT